MKKSFFFISFIIFIATTSTLSAQTFGFGCLGLSGFYSGYGVNTYEATGLNQNLKLTFPQVGSSSVPEFTQGQGFRAGANILRAQFDNVFFTAKGFFQFSKESKSYDITGTVEPSKTEYELSSNHWGIGIDFGFPIFSFLDLKLAEGGITFYNIEFKEKSFTGGIEVSETVYSNDETKVGYYVGTGLIINLIEGYISLEGTAMYHFYQVESVKKSDGTLYPNVSSSNPFIEKGGFAASVQFNIGFPL